MLSMKQVARFSLLSLTIYVGLALWPTPIFAQQQPATEYTFSGMTARQISAFGPVFENDFGISFSNLSPTDNTIRVQLIANNPSYRYKDGQIGTYEYFCSSSPHVPYPCPSDNLGFQVPYKKNVTLNVLYVAVDTGNLNAWTGTVRIWSVSGIPFYVFPTPDFTAANNSGAPSGCIAHYWAWQGNPDGSGGVWTAPVFWNAQEQAFISPYGNYWHNTGSWDKGWSSQIRITNNSASALSYRIEYHELYHGIASANPDTTCNQQGTGPHVHMATVSVPAMTAQTFSNVELFGFSTNLNESNEGTTLVYPLGDGSLTSVTHTVQKNASGTPLCDINRCVFP